MIAAPVGMAITVAARLDTLLGHPLTATAVTEAAPAAQRVGYRRVAATLVIGPAPRTDTVPVAGTGGPAVAEGVSDVLTRASTALYRQPHINTSYRHSPATGAASPPYYAVTG
ncbi:hypothetical protein [Streptomyces sp. NPDC047061]|uniref:hypothetical protein n=1 Tax=Streptomyces sp. NPDC047061 TaxID=3154605 RepID=UPI0033CC781A